MHEFGANIERLELNKVFIQAVELISKEEVESVRGAIENAKIDIVMEAISKNLIVSLNTFIVGLEDERFKLDIEWPKDWWEAFKDRWLPKLLLRYFPVVKTAIHVDKQIYKAICPHLEAKSQGPHLQWFLAAVGDKGMEVANKEPAEIKSCECGRIGG